MLKYSLVGVLACVLPLVAACGVPLPQGDRGSVGMVPFVDREHGIRGYAPLEGWTDRAILIQQSFEGTKEELVSTLVDQTDLMQLPRATGLYRGAHLTWDLYSFGTQLPDAAPGVYRVDLALAEANGGGTYMAIMVTRPMEYQANQAQFRAVFEHALYAMAPLD